MFTKLATEALPWLTITTRVNTIITVILVNPWCSEGPAKQYFQEEPSGRQLTVKVWGAAPTTSDSNNSCSTYMQTLTCLITRCAWRDGSQEM